MKTLYGGILLGHQCFHLSNYVTSLGEKAAPVIVLQKRYYQRESNKKPSTGNLFPKNCRITTTIILF